MKRLEKFKEVIRKVNADAFLISSIPNIRYLSAFSGEEGFLISVQDEIFIIVDPRFTEQANGEVQKDIKVIEYKGSFSEFLKNFLYEKKVHWLAFEKNHLDYSLYFSIEGAGFLKLIPLENTIENMRIVKDEEELESLRSAARISTLAFNETLPLIKEGASEREVAGELEYRFRKNGGEKPSFDTIIASGFRSALPHGVASQKRIEKGEPIIMDFGVFCNGYASDTTRTLIIGQSTEEISRAYEIVKEAQELGRAEAKSGVKASEVDAKVRTFLEKEGFGDKFTHGLGHGVGLEIHELPTVNQLSTSILKPGMVVTIEPGVYLPKMFGIRIEDTIIIKEEGIETITDITHDLIKL